jgi:2-dehydropantoate 2-reductase
MHEVIEAAGKLGHVIPETFIEQQIASTRRMGAYKPSSLIDYLAGREVEVDVIWGEPLRRAQAAGVEMPRLEMLHRIISCVTHK